MVPVLYRYIISLQYQYGTVPVHVYRYDTVLRTVRYSTVALPPVYSTVPVPAVSGTVQYRTIYITVTCNVIIVHSNNALGVVVQLVCNSRSLYLAI